MGLMLTLGVGTGVIFGSEGVVVAVTVTVGGVAVTVTVGAGADEGVTAQPIKSGVIMDASRKKENRIILLRLLHLAQLRLEGAEAGQRVQVLIVGQDVYVGVPGPLLNPNLLAKRF